jgi:hypothetical protein
MSGLRVIVVLALATTVGCGSITYGFRPHAAPSTVAIGGVLGDIAIAALANVAQAGTGPDAPEHSAFFPVLGITAAVDLAGVGALYFVRHR